MFAGDVLVEVTFDEFFDLFVSEPLVNLCHGLGPPFVVLDYSTPRCLLLYQKSFKKVSTFES